MWSNFSSRFIPSKVAPEENIQYHLGNQGWFIHHHKKCKCKFMLPEFHKHCLVEWEIYVDDSKSNVSLYNTIIGQDLVEAIGLDLLFSKNLMRWDNATVPMQDSSWFEGTTPNPFRNDLFSMHDPDTSEEERIQGILDIKYAPADLDKIVQGSTHLLEDDRKALWEVLAKYEDIFDGSLGTWITEPIDLELRPEAKPYHAKPYPVPHSQEKELKQEIERICSYGVQSFRVGISRVHYPQKGWHATVYSRLTGTE